ncbi:MAG: energy transducer TonB [Chitinophagaceae bacterium]
MKPENILKSDYLDILFENKNKDYGAYDLRKTYPKRLLKSFGIMLGCIAVFVGTQSWKTPKKKTIVNFGNVIDFVLSDADTKTKELEKPKPKTKQAATKPMAEVAYNVPKIVPNDIPTDVPPIEAIDTSLQGNKNNPNGPATENIIGVIAGPENRPGSGNNPNKKEGNETDDTIEDAPIYNPSEQPEYPGGLEALKSFMIRNLKQPDDIDEGTKIVVIAKFVVDKSGSIEQIEIVQSGRDDLDEEVKRVIKKMPHWKPGIQSGKPVDVYFKLPITFANLND